MKKKYQIIYAFVDSQNLNLGTSKNLYNKKGKLIYRGWRLDFKKFRTYLKDKFHVSKAYLFIGYIKGNSCLYSNLKKWGYELVFKPTTKDDSGKVKGNIDAELVLYSAAIEFKNYDKAVIVSGDGDFYCLHKFLVSKNKLGQIIIPNKKTASSLLWSFNEYKIMIEDEQKKLNYKKMGGVHSSNTQLEARILPHDLN